MEISTMRIRKVSGWTLAAVLAATPLTAGADQPTFQERFRPQFHYTPASNWMNDPNGLVWFRGQYHLFYQYNPFGDTWGHISWGHATSHDLVNWEEQPVALMVDDAEPVPTEMFFSGGAVADLDNSSAFGSPGNPPLVAIYTSFYPWENPLNQDLGRAGIQAQSLAYSTDGGNSWTPYELNPVIDLGSTEFRDPKVFWHEPNQEWIMSVVLATEKKVQFYASPDLKTWEWLSDFGPANATGGVWEVPDLFELPVDGDPDNSKWVLVVNLNPGAVAGGSGAQYFVGDFDGTTFTPDNAYDNLPPEGILFEDFEGQEGITFEDLGWTATGDYVGTGPVAGNNTGQGVVAGYQGERLANTFFNFDQSQGTLRSENFGVSKQFINLQVGGGNHPHDPNAGDGAVPAGVPLFPGWDFEGPDGVTFEELGWTASGDFVNQAIPTGSVGDQQPVSGYMGERLANSFIGSRFGVGGDGPEGELLSPEFQISHDYINFLIGGGAHRITGDQPTAVVLEVNGDVVRSASGTESEVLNWVAWDVREFAGQTGRIRLIDHNSGGWGHINADHFMASNEAARPLSRETAVNLIVDDEVVRTATGQNSEVLSWASWNVAEFIGQQAHIEIIDRNSGGWGHILVDHILFSETAKKSADWIDYGKDFYAVVSYENMPGDNRVWLGWMNNWQYANQLPTAPWRSAQSLPRDVSLTTAPDGTVQLVQQPVVELTKLRQGPAFMLNNRLVSEGTELLDGKGASGKALEIIAEFEPGTASRFGLKVRVGDSEETVVGYDALAEEVFVDRTRSQAPDVADFHPAFAGRHSGPLKVEDGVVKLHLFVDWSSVELFAGDGETVITDRIFPSDDSDGVALFAEDGEAVLKSLKIHSLRSIH
jgi:levanase